jgi:signal transduction histidine kinase
MDRLYVINERANISFFLIFAVSTGSVLLLLSLFFFFAEDRRGLFPFLLFCFFAATENVFRGEFLSGLIDRPTRSFVFNVLRSSGTAFLAVFFIEHLRVENLRKLVRALPPLAVISIGALAIEAFWGGKRIHGGHVLAINQAFLVAVLMVVSALAFMRWRRDVRGGRAANRSRESLYLAVLASAYSALVIHEYYLSTQAGFDKRAVYDLIFLYYMGFLSARRLGMRERQVKAQDRRIAQLQVESAVADITALVAHDVRRPFSVVRMMVAKLAEAPDHLAVKDVLTEFQPVFRESMEDVEGMLTEILQTSADRAPVAEPTPTAALVASCLSDCLRRGGRQDMGHSSSLRHTRMLLVERLHIQRALSNLLDNARQATPSGGRIWIETADAITAAGEYVHIAIGNSGSFVAPEDRRKIFEPFFSKSKRGGTGLGLAFVKKVVLRHGGHVWCESQAGSGTVFHLHLPAAAAADQPTPQPARTIAPVAFPRVVVIDDDTFILDAWRRTMTDAECLCYVSPEAVLAALASGSLDLKAVACIITDLTFVSPSTTALQGVFLVETLRKSYAGPLFVSSDMPASGEAWERLVNGFLPKEPQTFESLMGIRRTSDVAG